MSGVALYGVPAPPPRVSQGENPWTSDEVLLSLSIWWVKTTRPHTPDLLAQVGEVFASLQRDVQRAAARG